MDNHHCVRMVVSLSVVASGFSRFHCFSGLLSNCTDSLSGFPNAARWQPQHVWTHLGPWASLSSFPSTLSSPKIILCWVALFSVTSVTILPCGPINAPIPLFFSTNSWKELSVVLGRFSAFARALTLPTIFLQHFYTGSSLCLQPSIWGKRSFMLYTEEPRRGKRARLSCYRFYIPRK